MAKTRILIVDDEKSFTRIAKINLERTGKYRVREENKGSRALAAAHEFDPHIILLDIIMPDLGGGDVAAQIKDDPKLKDVPIVFVTALIKKTEERTIRGSSYIAKPVKLQTLIACIEKILRN
jgi:CheY-like chemotaxis protein